MARTLVTGALDSSGAALPLCGGQARSRPGSAMATLYRCNTPTNWLCPCGKVARALHLDGIDFQSVVVGQRRSRRPEVEALSGQRRVPVLIVDGDVISDSRRIVEHLELRRAPHS